ncbi:ATP-binding protein [bacterium]|nr:ATP-binding protein [bacterium]
MYIDRLINEELFQSPKSILLVGPRQTGKSTLIQSLKPDLQINLASESEFLAFASNPEELVQRLAPSKIKTILIDEVQRLPTLLNTVQSILDNQPKRFKFYLTGSSARKLKRGKANLLPGRIFTYRLGTICSVELNYQIDTTKALETGMLPGIYTEPSEKFRQKTLRSYASTYLKEEIQAEALTRNLEGFSRFIYVAAAQSGQFLDMTKLASQAQINRQAAVRYFEILEDTLIVNRCPSFSKKINKRLVSHPKYYLFDTGVLNSLLGSFQMSPDRVGPIFETLVFNQILSSAYARDLDIQISTYRTTHGAEVDFIVELNNQTYAIEVKHTKNIGRSDINGLKNFKKTCQSAHIPMIFYIGDEIKQIEDTMIYPWQTGLKELGL